MVQKNHNHLLLKKPKTTFDFIFYFFMVATPLFELPQAFTIYFNQSAANVSIWTWAFFASSSIVWFFYGLRHRLTPILITYSLYFLIECSIVVGILLYY